MGKYLFCFLTIAAFGIPALRAQDDENKQTLRERIDRTVENIMNDFDERLGTYIFREEPADENAADVSPDFSGRSEDSGYKLRRGSALYAVSLNRSIVRNNFPALPWESADENLLFRYNRVEGLFLGLNFPKTYNWNGNNITLFGSGGYGLAGHRWRGGLGFAHQTGTGGTMFEIGIEGHSMTDTHDQWLIGVGENNLAAIFVRDDYRDYFGREGFSSWVGLYKKWHRTDMQVEAAFVDDIYEPLEKETNWSVFNPNKLFRENPAVPAGRMKSVLTTLKLHSTETRRIFTTGWSVVLSAEIAGQSLGGDFDFNSYIADIRRYQPISMYDNLNVRIRAASATGEAPPQKTFSLGGLGTVPAFGFKEFTGNRALIANAEYVVNGKMFDNADLFPSWLLRNVNIILFADAGYVSAVKPMRPLTEGFDKINSETVKSDWGFALGTRDAKLRFGCAWRTDKAGPPLFFVRLNRPF